MQKQCQMGQKQSNRDQGWKKVKVRRYRGRGRSDLQVQSLKSRTFHILGRQMVKYNFIFLKIFGFVSGNPDAFVRPVPGLETSRHHSTIYVVNFVNKNKCLRDIICELVSCQPSTQQLFIFLCLRCTGLRLTVGCSHNLSQSLIA